VETEVEDVTQVAGPQGEKTMARVLAEIASTSPDQDSYIRALTTDPVIDVVGKLVEVG
jgi:hypothetical protein